MPSSQVLHKFKAGKLHSGSKKGPVVKKRGQALAIMLSEKRAEKSGRGHGKIAAAYAKPAKKGGY